ncbi:MAG: MFS transporter [Proteobacteria bacterium]|nr:MFS transporter [Pseudomonadota bacterium]
MSRERLSFLYLNIGHFLDHLFTLVFATVAALALTKEWGMSYSELVPYATPGFMAFGLFSLPAGRLADRWSRHGMMVVFFLGIGAASILAGFAQTPVEMGALLFVVGVLAAIYHPVGLAMVVESAKGTATGMAIGINGVWGNLGVGSAALITGWFIDHGGWRSAFIVPGLVSILIGLLYWLHVRGDISAAMAKRQLPAAAGGASRTHVLSAEARSQLLRLTVIVFFTTAVSSLIFQSTTFALPKMFDERLRGIAGSATLVGWLAFIVFGIASLAQLVVGRLLDTLGPRTVFMGVAAIQIVFFAAMPGLRDWPALAVALGFMLGAFGQIPINDYMIGRMAKSERRATVYGVRYVVSFTVLAAALPLIAYLHGAYGFDVLFRVLAVAAALTFGAVALLPKRIPEGGVAAVAAAE